MDRVSINKYLGCLMGGAIGEALRAPIEFDSIDHIKATYGEKFKTRRLKKLLLSVQSESKEHYRD